MNRFLNILILLAFQFVLFAPKADAQSTDRDYIRLGNRHYHKGEFDKALTNFTKALEKKKTVEAYYNFANAALAQGQDSTANVTYMMADSLGFTNSLKRAKNFHNMGNIWYMQGVREMRSNGQNAGKAFETAVNLYKCALRCNPEDWQTRYNLAMAQHQLKKNQNGGGGGGNDDKNQDKDKDKKDEQKKEEQKKQEQQQNQQQQQQDKDQMSDQAAEQLLNSAQQDEKNVQQKVKVNPQRRKSLEKDW